MDISSNELDNIEDKFILSEFKQTATSYKSLAEDVDKLGELFVDVHNLVQMQQVSLDHSEDIVETVQLRVVEAEKNIQQGSIYQTSFGRLKTTFYILAGTAIGASFGSVGLLVGIKPLTTILVGGGCGFLFSAVKQII